MKIEKEKIYTVEELSETGIGTAVTVRGWIKTKKLKASLVGRKYLISGTDVLDMIQAGTSEPAKMPKRKKTNVKRKR